MRERTETAPSRIVLELHAEVVGERRITAWHLHTCARRTPQASLERFDTLFVHFDAAARARLHLHFLAGLRTHD